MNKQQPLASCKRIDSISAWVPGLAFEQLASLSDDSYGLAYVVTDRRKRGRGESIELCFKTLERANDVRRWFDNEADFWSGAGVDPDARFRARPCRIAAERIAEAIEARVEREPPVDLELPILVSQLEELDEELDMLRQLTDLAEARVVAKQKEIDEHYRNEE